MIVGIDLDNTLIDYKGLFYKAAIELKLINNKVYRSKDELKEILDKANDNSFSILQGYVYGKAIKQATPTTGCIKALNALKKHGYEIKIISHKTRWPYYGE